jgi:hypothetical protein
MVQYPVLSLALKFLGTGSLTHPPPHFIFLNGLRSCPYFLSFPNHLEGIYPLPLFLFLSFQSRIHLSIWARLSCPYASSFACLPWAVSPFGVCATSWLLR